MTHKRIRKFNTKDTYPEQNLNNDLCHAVVTEGGKTIWMRGQCPQNLDDGINIKSNDPAEQTHKVMQNIKQLIEEAGGSMEHLVKIVIYITDINNREAIYNVIGEYTKGVYPVSTGLVVNRLARPEWLVEIDATAVIPFMTFSLIARCEKTNMFGVVISSSSISVASRCPWVRAGTGAAATQNVTDPSLGNLMLDYLEQGMSPQDVINKIKNEKTNIDYRQLLLIDSSGKTFSYSGNKILGTHGVAEGTNCIAAGNMLKSKDIPSAMVDSFKNNSNLFFPERLMLSLKAGLTAGGEEGSIHSAGIKVVDDTSWPLIDLRIDWSDNDPIEELYKLWKAYEPQMNDYKSRALDPTQAPSYGVPGDL